MTDIIKLLSNKDQEQFTKHFFDEHEDIHYSENICLENRLTTKIAENNATNLLLIETEKQLTEQKTKLTEKQITLKYSSEYTKPYEDIKGKLKEPSLKEREEKATLETIDIQKKIDKLEHKKDILQANLQGLQYEIRLLFKQL